MPPYQPVLPSARPGLVRISTRISTSHDRLLPDRGIHAPQDHIGTLHDLDVAGWLARGRRGVFRPRGA
jgi:hypothetical protein